MPNSLTRPGAVTVELNLGLGAEVKALEEDTLVEDTLVGVVRKVMQLIPALSSQDGLMIAESVRPWKLRVKLGFMRDTIHCGPQGVQSSSR